MKKIWRLVFLIIIIFICYACENQPASSEILSRSSIVDRKDNTNQTEDLTPPTLQAKGWEQPIPLIGPINTSGGEDSPFFDSTRNALFFFFTPDTMIPAEEQVGDGFTGIYISYFKNGEWSEPERIWLTEGTEHTLDGCPTVRGDMLWFCSIRDGNYRSIDFWTATYDGEEWGNIHNAGQELNEIIGIGEMDISNDNQTILFHAALAGGMGENDLWTTSLTPEGWNQPQNLGSINTEFDDSRPFYSDDNDEIWFTRTYQGSPAIYRSTWDGEEWSSPQLIISQFAGEPTIDQEGNIYFAHHFVRDGKIYDADIYIAYKK